MFLPAGSQDETGTLLVNRAKAYETFRYVTEKRNFKQISTPAIEYASTFTNRIAGMNLNEMMKWFNKEGEIEVLRPDWTTAIARAVAKQPIHQQKWSYQGSVFRIDKDGTESRQAGIEIVHANSVLGERECMLTAIDYLKSLHIDQYVIELGHTEIFDILIQSLKLDTTQEDLLRTAMHDKRRDVVYQLVNNTGNSDIANHLTELTEAYGNKDIITKYQDLWSDNDELLQILENLNNMIELIEATTDLEVIVDLGRVKNLPYYDGMMFRGFLKKDGSTCFSGGRYDRLYKYYQQDTTAVGLAFDVDVLASHMTDHKEKKRACIIASEKTHQVAEAFRNELTDYIVEVSYDEQVTSTFDLCYKVMEQDNEYKVVKL